MKYFLSVAHTKKRLILLVSIVLMIGAFWSCNDNDDK